MDKHDTIGLDLVAMVVDDLVVCGAEPLFLQDYIAVGKVVPEQIATIVSGIAEGCRQAGCALLGGETAEHPGLMAHGSYDLSATGVGIVDADDVLRPERVRPGDVLVAMSASGLHSNGYSLARHVLLDIGRMPLHGHVEEFGHTLGEELLTPTRIYARDCLAVAAETDVRTFAHITGGGLARNLERVLPPGLEAVVERGSWTPAPVFGLIAARGRVERAEMEKTFNMGVGMVAVLPAGRRRPRAGGAHRPARAVVGARLGAPGGGTARPRTPRPAHGCCSWATTRASSSASSSRRGAWAGAAPWPGRGGTAGPAARARPSRGCRWARGSRASR